MINLRWRLALEGAERAVTSKGQIRSFLAMSLALHAQRSRGGREESGKFKSI